MERLPPGAADEQRLDLLTACRHAAGPSRVRRPVLAALVATLGLAACGGTPNGQDPGARASAAAPTTTVASGTPPSGTALPPDVAARPVIGDADARYRALFEQVERAARGAGVGAPASSAWKVSNGPCTGLDPQAPVTMRQYGRAGLFGAVTKRDWTRVEQAVAATLRPLGYTGPQDLSGGVPDDRLVRWTGKDGATLDLGMGRATMLRLTSACHPTG